MRLSSLKSFCIVGVLLGVGLIVGVSQCRREERPEPSALLGKTETEVRQAWGEPSRIIEQPDNSQFPLIWYYGVRPRFNVAFRDGRVVDIGRVD